MNKSIRCLGFLIIGVVLIVGVFGAYRLISGRSLDLRSLITELPRSAVSLVRSALDRGRVQGETRGQYTNVIFLHHSVGQGIIAQGNLRSKLTQAGFSFYDHDYNEPGLTYPDGQQAGYNYLVPGDNTDINGLLAIFQQPVYPLPVNTLSGLLQHEVIIVKSCFPNNHIASDDALTQDKTAYIKIREVMRQHPEKLFIILTSPPLNPAETNLDEASRARKLADWLASDEYRDGTENLSVFDLFSQLAEGDVTSPEANQLRAEYRAGSDSHPNQAANEKIAGILAVFVEDTVKAYREKTQAE